MSKLLNDLSTITGISKHALEELADKSQVCICHAIKESMLEKTAVTEIDIGIGTLYIKVAEDEVRYKFIPSKKLDTQIAFTLCNKESPLVIELNNSLKSRIEKAYKGLF